MNRLKRILVTLMLVGFTVPAHADNAEIIRTFSNIPKLNREVVMSKEDFDARTKLISETPGDDKYLAFNVKLGKDWTKLQTSDRNKNVGLNKQILGEVSTYLGPPYLDRRSSFRLKAVGLTFDVTAKDWFLNYIQSNNYTLQGLEVTSERRVQAQYIMVEDGAQNIVRAVAEISGPRIIMAEYIVPVEAWTNEKDMAKRSMASFYLTSNDHSSVENLESYSFVDIAKFQFPQSWVLSAPPIGSIERMNASIINLKGGVPQKSQNWDSSRDIVLMDGKIDISVITKNNDTNIQKEVLALKQQLLEKGLVLGDLIEPITDWKYNENIVFARIEAYKINNKASKLADYEEWIGVFESPGRIYLIRLLTVGRNDNFLTWARNVRAYRTVIATLSPANQ